MVAKARFESFHELSGKDLGPVPAAKELVLGPTEEPLAGGVVGRAALL